MPHSYDRDIADLKTPAQLENIEFPQKIFTGKLRSFNKNWFSRFNCSEDAAVCFASIKAMLMVRFHLTMLNKHLLKQDIETRKRR